jgi:putative oxidoreductase
MGVCKWYTKRFSDYAYLVFRVLVGLGFFFHGAQKLFGLFGGTGGGSVAIFSLMGLAGLIETIGGVAILLGIFTRLVSSITALEMLIAYFMVHFPQSWNPLLNGGEVVVLYFATFLAITVYGNGKFSLEKKLWKKEIF